MEYNRSFEVEYGRSFEVEYNRSFEVEYNRSFEVEYNRSFEVEYNRSFEVEYTRSFVFIHCFIFERGRPTINRFFRNCKLNKADVLQVIYYCDVYYYFINSFISYTPTLSWEGLAADRTG